MGRFMYRIDSLIKCSEVDIGVCKDTKKTVLFKIYFDFKIQKIITCFKIIFKNDICY